jgi:hypothetical protein
MWRFRHIPGNPNPPDPNHPIPNSLLCDDLDIFQGTLILQTLITLCYSQVPNSFLFNDLDITQGTLILQTLITLSLIAFYVTI